MVILHEKQYCRTKAWRQGKKSMKLETVLLEQALVVSTLIKAESTLSQHYATAVILKKLQHILSLHYC